MADTTAPGNSGTANETLQFDKAEGSSAGTPTGTDCTACSQKITGDYYEAGGKVICPTCRVGIEKSLTGGSRSGRYFKALGMGSLAALLGTLLYYAILKLTGYEFGLVAIVVGFMVGWAVRQGSKGRGGWAYQGMAMFLTYLSIVTTYVPYIIEGITNAQGEDGDVVATSTAEPAAATGAEATPQAPAEAPAATPAADQAADIEAASADGATGAPHFSGPVAFVVGWILILMLACAAPWLAGFQNIMGWAIIGFAVYQAWSMNRKMNVEITGPYQTSATPAPTP